MSTSDERGPETGPAARRGPAGPHVHPPLAGAVDCAVVTVSDTRTAADDTGGDLIRALLVAAGHRVVASTIVPDEPERVAALLTGPFAGGARVVLLTGGTGISHRDRTFEAVSGLLEKTLPGFGELFRALSFHEIGPAAMLSRAVAGTHRGRLVVAMPGSPHAVRLAMERLVVPELRHAIWELARHE